MLSTVSWMWAALLDRVSGIDSLFLVGSWLPVLQSVVCRVTPSSPASFHRTAKVGREHWCGLKGDSCGATESDASDAPTFEGSAAQQDWWSHFHLWCLAATCFDQLYAFIGHFLLLEHIIQAGVWFTAPFAQLHTVEFGVWLIKRQCY